MDKAGICTPDVIKKCHIYFGIAVVVVVVVAVVVVDPPLPGVIGGEALP